MIRTIIRRIKIIRIRKLKMIIMTIIILITIIITMIIIIITMMINIIIIILMITEITILIMAMRMIIVIVRIYIIILMIITIISPYMYIIVNKVFTYPTSVNHLIVADRCVQRVPARVCSTPSGSGTPRSAKTWAMHGVSGFPLSWDHMSGKNDRIMYTIVYELVYQYISVIGCYRCKVDMSRIYIGSI
jgi:hypothetical protein